MRHIKLFESFTKDDIVQNIKDWLTKYNDEKNWDSFVDNQELGDCQIIVSNIKDMKLPGVQAHFGHITTDEPYYSAEEDEEADTMTHHWVTINGDVYEFSKGTLKGYVYWDNIYCPEEDVDESIYSKIG